MRRFRCTLCLESFDTEIDLKVHLLSQGHRDRARPGYQNEVMALYPMDVEQLPTQNIHQLRLVKRYKIQLNIFLGNG